MALRRDLFPAPRSPSTSKLESVKSSLCATSFKIDCQRFTPLPISKVRNLGEEAGYVEFKFT